VQSGLVGCYDLVHTHAGRSAMCVPGVLCIWDRCYWCVSYHGLRGGKVFSMFLISRTAAAWGKQQHRVSKGPFRYLYLLHVSVCLKFAMSGAQDARAPVAPACATERFGTAGGGVVGARSAGDVPEVGDVVVGAGQPVLAGAYMSRAQAQGLMARACATVERSGTVGSGIVGAPLRTVRRRHAGGCGLVAWWSVIVSRC